MFKTKVINAQNSSLPNYIAPFSYCLRAWGRLCLSYLCDRNPVYEYAAARLPRQGYCIRGSKSAMAGLFIYVTEIDKCFELGLGLLFCWLSRLNRVVEKY